MWERAGKEYLEAAFEADVNFSQKSTYIDDYLNKSGEDGYRDLDIFYGLKGLPDALPQLGLEHVVDSTKFIVGKI